MKPLILNLDSAFDWTVETGQLWEQICWEEIRKAVATQVSSRQWAERRDGLGLIGLVSNLVIEESYDIPGWERCDRPEQRDDPMLRDWRERQLGKRENERSNSQAPRRCRLTGEEPFLRSPRVGRLGIVECYGIYVDDASTILAPHGFINRVTDLTRHAPAIFLCPERVHEVYPTLLRLDVDLRHPLPLSLNPALASLLITLLHELGHHFLPLHRDSDARRFLCEGLANLFCHHALNQGQQTWLLYKTWHLQPPEYSAYRPLDVLREADDDCRLALGTCFHGNLKGFDELPAKDTHGFERNLGASLNMAMAADAAACCGLWSELCHRLSDENRSFLYAWEGNHMHMLAHHLHEHGDGEIPADLVLDLYRESDLTAWAAAPGLPNRLWGHWGMENAHWPEDCLQIADNNADKWIELYHQTPYPWVAEAVRRKLFSLRSNARVRDYVSGMLSDPDCRPAHLSLEEAILTLDWMLTVVDPGAATDTSVGGEETLYHLLGHRRYDALYRNFIPSADCAARPGPAWVGPLVEFANRQCEEARKRRIYALRLLRRIPGECAAESFRTLRTGIADEDLSSWHSYG